MITYSDTLIIICNSCGGKATKNILIGQDNCSGTIIGGMRISLCDKCSNQLSKLINTKT